MMRSGARNSSSTRSRESNPRKTVAILVAVGVAVSVWQFSREHYAVSQIAGTVAALLGLCAISGSAARLVHDRWMALAHVLGYVNSRVLLTLTFFLIIVPTGMATRMAKRDALQLKGKSVSYWTMRRVPAQSKAAYERSF